MTHELQPADDSTSLARLPAEVRHFGGAPIESDFLLDPNAIAVIVQYDDGRTAVWQADRLVAAFDPGEVLSIGYEYRTTYVRKTPAWAVILGVLGLFFFLIGVVFFFVKETIPVMVPVLTVRLRDGRRLTITQPATPALVA